MVTDEAYGALQGENAGPRAENAQLQQRVEALTAQVAAMAQRITELEAKKTPPPSFVKANVPARPPRPRKRRAAEHNHARRREPPTQIIEHPIRQCPDCGGALGGGMWDAPVREWSCRPRRRWR